MGDYLYIAKVDKNDDIAGDAWEGKLNNVKQQMIKKTENIEAMMKNAQTALVDNLHTQTEVFIQLLKDSNQKNDQKLQFVIKKMEGGAGGSKIGGRKDSQSSFSAMGYGSPDHAPSLQKGKSGGGGLGALGSLFGGKNKGSGNNNNLSPFDKAK